MSLYALDDLAPTLAEGAWAAPSADLIGDVRLGRDASVWFGAVIRADGAPIEVGEGSNVQDGCVLHSDPSYPVIVGAQVSIGHRAVVHGCTVEDDVLVGIGAILLNGAVVGRGSLVAAGSVVLEGIVIPPDSLVAGVPGKVKREVAEAERERMRSGAESYVTRARHYRDGATG